MPIQLGWREEGFFFKWGDKESQPFKRLQFDVKFDVEGKLIEDKLKTILSQMGLEGEELTEAAKDVFKHQIGKREIGGWTDIPTIWMAKHPKIWNMYMNHLERWVKHDEMTKRIIFLTGISAYSHNPINLFLRGPSSTGKTYVTLQTLKYFPRKDVWLLGGLSPSALVHEYGMFVDSEDRQISTEDIDWSKADKMGIRQIVDLSSKILVFLEAPHLDTLARLRPILSHDTWEIAYKFADRSRKGSLVTRTAFIRGWPATIFTTTDPSYREELATRSINMTPEMTEVKYRDAILMQGEKASDPWRFVNPDMTLILYQDNLEEVKRMAGRFEAVMPFGEELAAVYPHGESRDMRDFGKLTTLIQQHTFLHIYQRPWLEGVDYDGRRIVLSTLADFKEATALFSYVAETTRSGLPGNVVSFFNEVMVSLEQEHTDIPIGYDDVVKKWMEVYKVPRSRDTLKRSYLYPLMQAGWVDEYPDSEDKRRVCLKVLHGPEQSLAGFEKEFRSVFNEGRLERWVAHIKAEMGKVKVSVGGEEIIWEEFPYRYFNDWV